MMSTSDPPADHDQEHVDDQYLDSFPVGYRFMPTDEEVLHYLTLRYQKKQLPPNRINEIILYDHHPEYLTSPGRFKAYENQEWYFFTPRDRKYRNGNRPKRSACTGYWKATGADKKILLDEVTQEKLGSKKTLVFYEGKALNGIKTNWVMNEFKLDQTSIQMNSRADMLLDDSVLCRIHIKKIKKPSDKRSSRKKKSVQNDHSLSSLAEEEEEDDDDDLREEEEEEEDHLQEESDLSVRGETDVYNDMEYDHRSNYDSIMQQYYPTDLHQILNNNSSTPYSSNIMGAISSSSSTTAVRGATNIMPLQTCPPNWVSTAPSLLNNCYMDTSGNVAPDMVSMSATHITHSNNIRQGYDHEIQQWGYNDMLMSSLSSLMVQDGHRAPLSDQQWVNSLSSMVPGLPAGHPPLPHQQWGSSLSSWVPGLPAGHPPLPQKLKVPQGYSPTPLPQMPPQMPSQMQMQQHGYHHHQYSSSSWAEGNNNIDDSSSSSSGMNKLQDHAIRRECRERHMENYNNGTNEHPEYLNAGENLEGFDQTPFSTTFNCSTLPDCGWSRR